MSLASLSTTKIGKCLTKQVYKYEINIVPLCIYV